MGPRGAGRRLNDQERMEILDILARETKVKNVDLAKRYGVSEGAIRKLKQVKDRIRDRYFLGNEHNRDKRKRGGFTRNAQFEQELYDWILRMREAQAYQLMPLTQTAVRQQAMLLAQKYERMSTFKASPGWFARFCSRHRLDPPMTNSTGGAASATASLSAASSSVLEVPTIPAGVAGDETKDVDAASAAAAAAAAAVFLPVLTDTDALMADVKHEDGSTEEELKCSETIDEQTKIAARQHNEVALIIAKASAAGTSAALDLSVGHAGAAMEESKIDATKAAGATSSSVTGGDTTSITATTTTTAATSIVTAAVEPSATVSEDEIFSLGL